MNRKDILELKRRFKKDECTFTKMCGCYVNGEKRTLLEFRETFLNLPEEDFFKYLDISKKVLSGGVGNNLLELTFPMDENFNNEKQSFLMKLKKSGLKDDSLLREFYQTIIDTYEYTGNFLILVYHDVYDVITKTSDNMKLDESEEVYEYILCAICPVSLSKPGLGYFDQEHKIKARIRDWIVGVPVLGFVYPGFIDRSSDINTLMYYTKNTKEPHPELMETALGCQPKKTATNQKESFQSIIKNSVSSDDEISEKIYLDIQDNLNTMIEEYNEIYDNTDASPITLTKEKVHDLLIDSGVSEEASAKIEANFQETFAEELPIAEHLVDSKLLKANEHKKREDQLNQQVEKLESELIKIKKSTSDQEQSDPSSTELNNDNLESSEDTINTDDLSDVQSEDPNASIPSEETKGDTSNYDVVLHVKPDKVSKIKTEIINGQRCILVPINDDEQATINGMNGLI